MMLARQPLMLAEVQAYLKDADETRPVYQYVKQFTKVSYEQAQKIKQALIDLNNPKLNEELVVKLVDVLPTDAEGVHKVCVDAGLSEDECQKVLGALAG